MRAFVVVTVAVALLVTAGVAMAAPVTVNFGVLGTNTLDITAPNSLNLNGVTFMYDNFGSVDDFASADATGIYGTTYGGLLFNFDAPATSLDFNFSLLSAPGPSPDDLVVLLTNAGADVAVLPVATNVFNLYDPNDPSQGGDALGKFSYNGARFDQAVLFFATDAPIFTVDSVKYTPAAVPEPSSIVAALALLVGVGGTLRRRR